MLVWLVKDEEHGEDFVHTGDETILENDFIKTELSYLDGGYEDERDEFIADVHRALRRGSGSAHIEERLSIELQEF